MLRLSALLFLVSILTTKLFAINVIIAKEDIHFNKFITLEMITMGKVQSVKRHCVPSTIDDFRTKKVQATHYMKKGYVICKDDIKEFNQKSVLFDFGAIEIEKNGRIIFENDEYIRIKKSNGDIEKIYKDGRIK
ncbi:hypothetical protein CRV01_03370 [Arcobacter sp. CECT 8983]|uniref:hypothetical protein n=1 Tax=Arcobacter sp. CECT 8983 TaxID=2044508 RepID=UPI00100AD0EA|nr:hypothetical protein [Arcobacter sp. CECT 8983]RXJ90213.1 hypothetical protein CRV01_03370 [Arcobacter sp. CECT 8983]